LLAMGIYVRFAVSDVARSRPNLELP
jgi:hypothetical protein